MQTKSNKNRSQVGSRAHFWHRQEKVNKEFVTRVKHLYALLGQAHKAVRTINDRLIRLANYSTTSRKMLEAMNKQSHTELAKMKAELDDINQRLETVQRNLEGLGVGTGFFSPTMQSYLVYLALISSLLAIGLSLWNMMGS